MGKLSFTILSWFKKIAKQDIVRVFSFTAISTMVRMCTGLISVKIIALIIGPVGVTLLGQLNNFSTVIMSFAGGGINNGITKYVAEHRNNDENTLRSFLSTAIRITLSYTLLVSILLIIFHKYLSNIILNSNEYGYVFIIFGLTIFLYSFNMMLVAIVNGYKKIKTYIRISIAGSLIGLIFSVSFVISMELKGALISAVTYQSIIFFLQYGYYGNPHGFPGDTLS